MSNYKFLRPENIKYLHGEDDTSSFVDKKFLINNIIPLYEGKKIVIRTPTSIVNRINGMYITLKIDDNNFLDLLSEIDKRNKEFITSKYGTYFVYKPLIYGKDLLSMKIQKNTKVFDEDNRDILFYNIRERNSVYITFEYKNIFIKDTTYSNILSVKQIKMN